MLRTPQRALFVADRILTIYHGNVSPGQKMFEEWRWNVDNWLDEERVKYSA